MGCPNCGVMIFRKGGSVIWVGVGVFVRELEVGDEYC